MAASVGLAPPVQKHKVVFLGDQSVGKTSIIKHFIYGSYEHNYQATIGIDFFSKTVYLDARTVRLQLWDTAGQECVAWRRRGRHVAHRWRAPPRHRRFRSLIPSYIRDSSVAVITYDVTNRATFASTEQWVADVRAERGPDVIIMLVGNKTDLGAARKVSVEEGAAAAEKDGLLFAECSAKEGHNVKALFTQLATALPNPADAPPATDAQLIDVKLTPSVAGTAPGAAAGSGCAC